MSKDVTERDQYWQLDLSADQAQVVMTALGIWSSDYNNAPHAAIEDLRDRLERMGAAKR